MTLDSLGDLVTETHRGAPGLLGADPEQRMAAEMLVAALSSMVTTMVGVGETDRLPAMRAPMMEVVARLVTAST